MGLFDNPIQAITNTVQNAVTSAAPLAKAQQFLSNPVESSKNFLMQNTPAGMLYNLSQGRASIPGMPDWKVDIGNAGGLNPFMKNPLEGPNIQGPSMGDVMNAGVNPAMQQQMALLQQLQAQKGLAAQSEALNMARQGAMGQGPNPALDQLHQTTGQNIQNQAALMASQRGAAANPGMIARMAAQQGGALNQQAAGQAATLGSQQRLAQQGLFGDIAGTMAGNQINATRTGLEGALQNQGQIMGGMNAANQARMGVDSANKQLLGGVLGGAASMLTGMANGGEVQPRQLNLNIGAHMMNMMSGGHVPGKAAVAGDSPQNDTVPAMLSPGEVVIPRSVMNGKDPAAGAHKFVSAILARNKRK